MPFDAQMFPATYPWDPQALKDLSAPNLVNVALLDPMMRANQQYVIEADLYSGVEGWDYQNPYAWEANILETRQTLDPAYGIVSDTQGDVYRNVNATNGLIFMGKGTG